jgi:hypothetical protein
LRSISSGFVSLPRIPAIIRLRTSGGTMSAMRADGRHLADTAFDAREKLAAQIYSLEAVRTVCTEAAGKGYPGVTIKPPAPLDLARTEAGRAARAWLTDQGARAVWENRTDPATGDTFPVLVVSWD